MYYGVVRNAIYIYNGRTVVGKSVIVFIERGTVGAPAAAAKRLNYYAFTIETQFVRSTVVQFIRPRPVVAYTPRESRVQRAWENVFYVVTRGPISHYKQIIRRERRFFCRQTNFPVGVPFFLCYRPPAVDGLSEMDGGV